MALELITFAEMQDLLSLTQAALSDYPALSRINDTMIRSFEEFLGRDLNNTSRTETIFPGDLPVNRIYLPGIPVTAVTSVTVTVLGDSETYTENNEYYVTKGGLKLLTSLTQSKVVVVYTGGLSAVTEEPNLNRAALYQLAYEFQTKEHIGSSSVSTEGGNVQRPALNLLPETKRMLQQSMHPWHTGSW